uniref:Uncharacterized protein n=1 Tax=Strigamia maritima TaxID=126957 RepID=T1JN72_STRMM
MKNFNMTFRQMGPSSLNDCFLSVVNGGNSRLPETVVVSRLMTTRWEMERWENVLKWVWSGGEGGGKGETRACHRRKKSLIYKIE